LAHRLRAISHAVTIESACSGTKGRWQAALCPLHPPAAPAPSAHPSMDGRIVNTHGSGRGCQCCWC
jgi:hypothetical protein